MLKNIIIIILLALLVAAYAVIIQNLKAMKKLERIARHLVLE
jgi:hypothetical protein